MLKLTRKQELRLIDLGIQVVLDKMVAPIIKSKKPKSKETREYKMSPSARKALSKRMKASWEKRRREAASIKK